MISDFAFLGFSPVVGSVVILALLVILAFEVWMLVSAITNKQISDKARILWVIGMVLLHPFVAIAYYLTDYKKA